MNITDGSEKQNGYATQIRAQFVDGVNRQIEFASRPGWQTERSADQVAWMRQIADECLTIVSARFWLDQANDVRRDFSRALNAVGRRLNKPNPLA